MRHPSSIPALSAFDSSFALWREGYTFVSSRCEALGSDAFCTRIMLKEVVCIRGRAAAEQFYQPGRFTRRNAIPRTALALLQDWGSVQTLDGEAHRHRKRLFMDMMHPEVSPARPPFSAPSGRRLRAVRQSTSRCTTSPAKRLRARRFFGVGFRSSTWSPSAGPRNWRQ